MMLTNTLSTSKKNNKKKKSVTKKVYLTLIYAGLIFASLVVILPFLIIVITSFKTKSDAMSDTFTIIGANDGFSIQGYKEVFNYDFNGYVKNNLNGYDMDFMAINLLISYCDNNIGRIKSELEKLKVYKFNDKIITRDDVDNLVKKGYDSTIFNLIDEINGGNREKVINIYRELLMENETEEKILYTIANHYRLLYKVKIKSMSLSDGELIKLYMLHPYRLTKLKEQCRLVSGDKILDMLKSPSDIDINVKSGKMDISTGMFLFFEKL